MMMLIWIISIILSLVCSLQWPTIGITYAQPANNTKPTNETRPGNSFPFPSTPDNPKALEQDGCSEALFAFDASSQTQEGCNKIPDKEKFNNIPIINGVYCYNNGSGLCKAFAGRFEFYLNTFKDVALGPVGKSEHVDSNGYHSRVPVSYSIDGKINYADRGINWAREFRKNLNGKPLRLLSTEDFNWCGHVEMNWWPYKSAIIDHKSKGRYNIYFFNRQSCIYDTVNKKPRHFNTRFLHNTSLRIDLDTNPLIFAMEDKIAGEVRLVKNKRQHWFENEYKVVEKPGAAYNYFVEMKPEQTEPCLICGNQPLLSAKAYRNFTNLCLSDAIHKRANGSKNSQLVVPHCGFDEYEIADYPVLFIKNYPGYLLEVDLHNIPRTPKTGEEFFDVHLNSTADWEIFAKDGYTFSAMTTIPIDDSSCRVLLLYANFKTKENAPKDDEYYPVTFLADYVAKFSKNAGQLDWKFDRDKSAKELTNLNYVDDIAYLHMCQTVLIIFGPLYSEHPADKFGIDTSAPVDSIYELSIWELVNAFFAMPDSNTIWVLHRTNYIEDLKYTCASGAGKLVTAKKGSGKYYPRHGANQPKWIVKLTNDNKVDFSEEYFFERLGVFKGSRANPEAPDPSRFPLGGGDPDAPVKVGDTLWLYIVVGIAVLLIIAMCIICLLTLRHRRRRRLIEAREKSSRLHPSATVRSSNLPDSHMSKAISPRSALSHHSPGSSQTRRSGLSSHSSQKGPNRSSTSTHRSGLSSHSAKKGPNQSSASTHRSGLSSHNKGTKRPHSNSSAKTGRSRISSRSSHTKV